MKLFTTLPSSKYPHSDSPVIFQNTTPFHQALKKKYIASKKAIKSKVVAYLGFKIVLSKTKL